MQKCFIREWLTSVSTTITPAEKKTQYGAQFKITDYKELLFKKYIFCGIQKSLNYV